MGFIRPSSERVLPHGRQHALFVPHRYAAGIYLNEYMKDSWFKRFVKMMTNNLAGVPSIVFGLFGMSLFREYTGVRRFHPGRIPHLSLLALPVVIRVTEEAFAGGRSIVPAGKPGTLARPNCKPSAGGTSDRHTEYHYRSYPSVGRVSGETAPDPFTVAAYFCLNCLPASLTRSWRFPITCTSFHQRN